MKTTVNPTTILRVSQRSRLKNFSSVVIQIATYCIIVEAKWLHGSGYPPTVLLREFPGDVLLNRDIRSWFEVVCNRQT